MCLFILSSAVSFLVSVASSTVVAIVFYRLSSRDTEALHRQSQLDSASLKLRQLDPRSWSDNYRGHSGVDNTIHWFICMSEVMEEVGFIAGKDALLSIVEEMHQVCSGPNSPSQLTAEEAEQRKTAWKQRISALRGAQPRSLLNRTLDK